MARRHACQHAYCKTSTSQAHQRGPGDTSKATGSAPCMAEIFQGRYHGQSPIAKDNEPDLDFWQLYWQRIVLRTVSDLHTTVIRMQNRSPQLKRLQIPILARFNSRRNSCQLSCLYQMEALEDRLAATALEHWLEPLAQSAPASFPPAGRRPPWQRVLLAA